MQLQKETETTYLMEQLASCTTLYLRVGQLRVDLHCSICSTAQLFLAYWHSGRVQIQTYSGLGEAADRYIWLEDYITHEPSIWLPMILFVPVHPSSHAHYELSKTAAGLQLLWKFLYTQDTFLCEPKCAILKWS